MKRNLNSYWARLDRAYYVALLKDTILDRLIDKDNSNPYALYEREISLETDELSFSIGDIVRGTSPGVLTVNVLAFEIANQGKIILKNTGNKNGGNVYTLRITEAGIYFLGVEGGYVGLYCKSVRQKIWLFSKTLAAFLNACAIIYLTYVQAFSTDQDKKVVQSYKVKTHKIAPKSDSLKATFKVQSDK